MMGTAWGVAALLGPAFGGFVAAFGDWRLAFWIDLPLALLVALLAEKVLPSGFTGQEGAKRPPVGRLGVIASAAIAVSAGGIYGRFWPALIGCVVGLSLIVLVVRADGRGPSLHQQRLFPSGVFLLKTRFGAITSLVALVAASGSAIIYVPYVITVAHGQPAVAGGFMSALSALSWTTASLLCASATGSRARRLVVAGPSLMTVGVACTGPALASGSLIAVAAAIALTGVGIGLAWPHLGALLIATADESERDAAGSFISTVQMVAAAFGSALVGMIANAAGMGRAVDDPAAIAEAGKWLFLTYSIVPAMASLMAVHALVLTPWKDTHDA
jgi:MFS family permease